MSMGAHLLHLVASVAVLSHGCASPTEALPYGASTESCATCHAAQAAEVAYAPHATSGTSPVFEALLPRVAERWGDRAHDACVRCHSPGHGGDVGIGCVSCHAAVGNNGSRDGLLVVDLDAPLAGPFDDPSPNAAHASTTRGLLSSPELCGTCHEVTAPGLLDEPTLTEHLASPAAELGIGCIDCHMPDEPRGEIASGAGRARIGRSHRFVGVDPPWGAPEEVARENNEQARALLASAVALSLEPGDAPGEVVVVLENRALGHAVPTGAAFLRDLFVDVVVTREDGTTETLSRVAELGTELLAHGVPVSLVTDADEARARALRPDETRRIAVLVGEGALAVEAVFSVRAVRYDALDALGLASRRSEVPTLEVARATFAPAQLE
jgi:hypothetical protein